jgi:integrase
LLVDVVVGMEATMTALERAVRQIEKKATQYERDGEIPTGVRGFRCRMHHGSWAYFFSALLSDTGKRKFQSLGHRDTAKAIEQVRQVAQELSVGKTPAEITVTGNRRDARGLTVAQLGQLFLTERSHEISVETLANHRQVLQSWVIGRPANGRPAIAPDPIAALPVHAVTPDMIETLLLRVRRTKNQFDRFNGRGQAKNVLDTLRALFAWGIRKRLLLSRTGAPLVNPAIGLAHAVLDAEQDSDAVQRPPRPIPIDKQDELLEFTRRVYGHAHYTFVLVGLRLGLRIGEIIPLEIEDFDMKRGVVHVQRRWSPQRGVLAGTKNKRAGVRQTRRVPLDLYSDLRPAVVEQIRLREKQNRENGWSTRLLFTTTGRPWNRNNIAHMFWTPVRRRLGLRQHIFHDTRHTFASEMIVATGGKIDRVAAWLGDTLMVVQQRYIHAIEESRIEKYDGIGDKLRRTAQS